MAGQPVAIVGVSVCGGVITGPGAVSKLIDGSPVSLVGDSVAPHGIGPHAAAVMVEGSANLFVGGVPVCRLGDAASCGHVVTNGAANFFD